MMDEKLTIETSSGACIFKKENDVTYIILIKSRNSKSWGIPKGHVEIGETIVSAAHREVYEEAGVSIQLHEKLDVITKYNLRNNVKKYVHAWIATQTCECDPNIVKKAPEVDLVQWHDVQTLPRLVEYQKNLIRQAIDKFLLTES